MKGEITVLTNGLDHINDEEINTLTQTDGTLQIPFEFKLEVGTVHRIEKWTIVIESRGGDANTVDVEIVTNNG